MKASEGLIPALQSALEKGDSNKFVSAIEDKLNSEDAKVREKTIEKLEKSIMCIDLEDVMEMENLLRTRLSHVRFADLC